MARSDSQTHPPQIAVVGTGAWGLNLVRNFHELGALYAFCDTDRAVEKAVARRYPGARAESDYLKLLADDDLDAVVLATPAAAHHPMALAALRAGKDVFVEKPLALRLSLAQELVQHAEASGRVLMVGHVLHFHPAVQRMAELISAGSIGRLRYLYSNRLDFGKIDEGQSILWSLGPHDISLILHLVGETPSTVLALGGAYINPHAADLAVTHLHFDSGVKAHIHVSWLHPFKDQRLVVIGERGMLVFDDQRPWGEKLLRYSHEVEWLRQGPVARKAEAECVECVEAEPLRVECAHFLDCIRSRRPPATDGREGLTVLRVLQAAQQSLDEARPVRPEELPAGPDVKIDDLPAMIHPTALAEGPGIDVGAGTRVWHFSKLLGPVKIGRRCTIGQNVVIERHVQIGDNVKIQNNVSVYSGVVLEDDTFCGPSMVFTNVATPRSHYPRKGDYLSTRVRRGASIGANATVVCGITLGRFALVGAGAVVTRDVPDYGLVYGNPARLKGWVCYCGATLQLGLEPGEEVASCAHCSRTYRRTDRQVIEQP